MHKLTFLSVDSFFNSTNKEESFFLGSEYSQFLKLKRIHDEIRLPGKRFHELVSLHEANFLNLSQQINQILGSDCWITQIASRNSSGVPLLRWLVYLAFIQEKIAQGFTGVFVCGERDFLEIAQSVFYQKHQVSRGTIYIKIIKRFLHYIWTFNLCWIGSRIIKIAPEPSRMPGVILRSWVSKEVFSLASYKDRNFGELPAHLERHGIRVLYSPLFFNLEKSYWQLLVHLKKSGADFLIPEAYAPWTTWVRVIARCLKTLKSNFSELKFLGLPVGEAVKSAHLRTAFPLTDLQAITFEYALPMIEKSFHIQNLIYTFENNPTEKILLRSVRKMSPKIRLLGFQHTVIYKEQLGFNLSPNELLTHPLPDYIITSGKRYLDILPFIGYPESQLVSGPGLRFSRPKPTQINPLGGVLVVLNFDFDQNLELLEKVKNPLSKIHRPIHIKLHPVLNLDQIIGELSKMNFPNYEFVEGSVQDLVANSGIVIMPACSVSNLEVLGKGVPLLRVSLGANFDFDPLWDTPPLPRFCSTQEEIEQFLFKALSLSEAELLSLNSFASNVISSYFEEVNRSTLDVFLRIMKL